MTHREQKVTETAPTPPAHPWMVFTQEDEAIATAKYLNIAIARLADGRDGCEDVDVEDLHAIAWLLYLQGIALQCVEDNFSEAYKMRSKQ